ncbi:hypothetical protein J2Y70_003345 [Xanthomonas translucens]|nr:hypothetical protein [Xanthomonas translucens]
MNQPNLLAALHSSGALSTLDDAFDPTLLEAADALSAGAALEPLSPWERGWGEGTSAHGAPHPVNQPNLLTALHSSGALNTLDDAFDPTLLEAADALSAGAALEPLSPRERGWGEGTSAHGAPTP